MYVAFIELCFGIGHNLSLICQMTSEDIKHQLIIITGTITATHFSVSFTETLWRTNSKTEWKEGYIQPDLYVPNKSIS